MTTFRTGAKCGWWKHPDLGAEFFDVVKSVIWEDIIYYKNLNAHSKHLGKTYGKIRHVKQEQVQELLEDYAVNLARGSMSLMVLQGPGMLS
jgi:hypothetical protein